MASNEVKHGAEMQNGAKEFVKSNLIFILILALFSNLVYEVRIEAKDPEPFHLYLFPFDLPFNYIAN